MGRWFRWALQALGIPVYDYSGSTLTSSVFALTANGSATTTLEATVYKNGVLASGEQVTYTVQRIQMNAADSFVSASPTDIDSDGVETSTITVQAAYRADGAEDYIGLPGIPAANVVLSAATATGNTLVQPATATDADGVTSGTLKTTDAATLKTVSAAILGITATDTAVVTTDGGYPVPPTPGDPFFSDSFASGSKTDGNGVTWSSAGTRVATSTTEAYDDTYSLRFRYGPDATGADSSAEQRFNLGQDCTELWVEWYLYVPDNFVVRADFPANNKLFSIWANSYSTVGDTQVVFEYEYVASGNYIVRVLSMNNNANTLGTKFTYVLSPAMAGTWVRFRAHFKIATTDTSNDGEIELWRDNTKIYEFLTHDFNFAGGNNYLRNGYFLGWANSGFTDETLFYIDAVKFYNTDPNWTF